MKKFVTYACLFAIMLSTLLLGVNELSVAKLPYLVFLGAVDVICAIIMAVVIMIDGDPVEIKKDY
jgi:hypothetical protein